MWPVGKQECEKPRPASAVKGENFRNRSRCGREKVGSFSKDSLHGLKERSQPADHVRPEERSFKMAYVIACSFIGRIRDPDRHVPWTSGAARAKFAK